MRIHVVEHAENDQEQPPEHDRHALADAAAVGIERGVYGQGSNVLPALGGGAAGLVFHGVASTNSVKGVIIGSFSG
jgi:hypothetical protein